MTDLILALAVLLALLVITGSASSTVGSREHLGRAVHYRPTGANLRVELAIAPPGRHRTSLPSPPARPPAARYGPCCRNPARQAGSPITQEEPMTPEQTTPVPHLVYGDSERNKSPTGPTTSTRLASSASGTEGSSSSPTRQTAERIVAAQQRIRGELTNPEDVDNLEWYDDTIVYTGVDDSVYRYSADEEGLYHCGFGWTWSEWTQRTRPSTARTQIPPSPTPATRGSQRPPDQRARPRRDRLGYPPVPDRRRVQRLRRRR